MSAQSFLHVNEIGQWTQSWCQTNNIACSFFDEIPSTNDLAKLQSAQDPDQLKVYTANLQTRGRGRGHNRWFNGDPGSALLSSWSYPLRSPPQPLAAPLVGLKLFQACCRVFPSLEWSIKPPNDLLLGGHKVAGLLLDSVQLGSQTRFIVGLGMNVTSAPSEVPDATYLCRDLTPGSFHFERWCDFLIAFKLHLDAAVEQVVQNELSENLRYDLRKAINANSRIKDPVLEISPLGDLLFEDHRISWQTL